jgi:DNA repair ATPase RecN
MTGNHLEERILLGLIQNYGTILGGTVSNDLIPEWQLLERHTPLESAYQNILAERDEALAPLEGVKSLSEEDILCNTNLQTAALFKKLSEKSNETMKELETVNETKKSLNDSLLKLESAIHNIKSICYSQEEGLDKVIKNQSAFLDPVNSLVQEKTHLLDLRRDELEKERDNLSRKLNALRKVITTGIHDLVKPEDVQKKMCPVCFDKEVNMVYIPCGHTYCSGCAELDRTRNAKCPQCRSPINARIKIFFTV